MPICSALHKGLRTHPDSLGVDQPVVAEGVAVGEVAGLHRERLLDAWDRGIRGVFIRQTKSCEIYYRSIL
jgi:hypothetical protein